jgi:hypothetical protein
MHPVTIQVSSVIVKMNGIRRWDCVHLFLVKWQPGNFLANGGSRLCDLYFIAPAMEN